MMSFRFGKARLGLAVVLASQVGLAQQQLSFKEKVAANAVANLVEKARKEGGLSKLRRISDHHLRQNACDRARKMDKSSGQSTGIGPPEKVGMISALWYSTLDPTQPSQELQKWAQGSGPQYSQPHRFAVGVCVVSSPEHSGELYWIDVGM